MKNPGKLIVPCLLILAVPGSAAPGTPLDRARTLVQEGHYAGAESTATAASVSRSHIASTAAFLPERQALGYAAQERRGIDTALDLSLKGGGSAREVWGAVVRSRAMVLEEMARRRRLAATAGDPDLEGRLRELSQASRVLANLFVEGRGPDLQEYRRRIEEARSARESAEKRIAAASGEYRKHLAERGTDLTEVLGSLPGGAVLVAYSLYQPVQPPGGTSGLRYAVFVSGPAIRLIDLGDAAEIDAAVLAWQREAGRPPAESRIEAEAAYRTAATQLRRKVWDPVASVLPGIERIFIVPDGSLSLVGYGSFPDDDGGYLVASGPRFHYLTAERDVVPGARGNRSDRILLVGGVDFDTPAGAPAADSPGTYRGPRPCIDLQSGSFGPLPHSLTEVDSVAAIWVRTVAGSPGDVEVLTGASASEEHVKHLAPGCRAVHLATHGFFLGADCRQPEGAMRGIGGLGPAGNTLRSPAVLDSPLLASGLVLAGANSSFLGREDGFLTAEELAVLDLTDTEWAVLSACRTGQGDVVQGEGVFGLRRALQVAGARTVIMSLWPVQDEAALRWMKKAYEARFADRLPTMEAVRAAALETLTWARSSRKTSHPFYWGGFVAAGDWR